MNVRGWSRLVFCLGVAALLAASGCSKHTGSPDTLLVASDREDSSSSSSSSLSSSEENVFEETGRLDRRLAPAMEAQVRKHFAHYLHDRRDTMERFLRNSLPYINHVKSVFRSRGLPEDLAYLAYLESGYNPLAVSRSNAVGMWQFISSTGKNFGLRQDWWMDERMDPCRSTEAAADYLERLYGMFKDWHLAVASYNGGEGKIGRAKAATGADSLHEIIRKNDRLDDKLQLREETVLYVPRFLAIAKIMRDPEQLGLKPADPDPDHPVLLPSVALTAKPATDLVELSRRLNMPWKEFLAYNPHFLRSISPAGRISTVYVPRTKELQARKLLAGKLSGAGWTYYKVKKKDTFARVSSATGVPVAVIKQLNSKTLKAGATLRLPARRGSVPDRPIIMPQQSYIASRASADHASAALAELSAPVKSASRASVRASTTRYTVKSGDTLFSIARACGTSVDDICDLNGGSRKLKTLKVGQQLKVPARTTAVASSAAVRSDAGGSRKAARSSRPATYTVKTGDTASAIAQSYDISLATLAEANGGMDALSRLKPGQVLKLSAPAPKAAPRAVAAAPAKAPARNASKTESYRVQSGETLWSISRKFNMNPNELLALNGMDTSTRVKVGDTVKVIRSK